MLEFPSSLVGSLDLVLPQYTLPYLTHKSLSLRSPFPSCTRSNLASFCSKVVCYVLRNKLEEGESGRGGMEHWRSYNLQTKLAKNHSL